MLAHDELRGRRAASPELLAAVRAASADGPRGDPALARGGPQRAATGGQRSHEDEVHDAVDARRPGLDSLRRESGAEGR